MRMSLQVAAAVAVALLWSCSSHANYALPSASNAHGILARGTAKYSETVLYKFSSPGYGFNYVSPLTPDGHGDYFGTTEVGGTGHGTVYELMPNGKGGWHESTLYAFTGFADGATPALAPLVLSKNGNLYGVTDDGGSNNTGVAYEMRHSGETWTQSVIYDFGAEGSVGVHPFSFIADGSGDFFGTVNLTQGGYWTEGVFELSPSPKGWTASLIFIDGIPSATSGGGGLTIDAKRNIFGVTSLAFKPSEVFELSPSGNSWVSKILYTFPGIRLDPEAPPVLDKMGNIYGATVGGGANRKGTIYELTPTHDGSWKREILYAFRGGPSDGEAPYASITFDSGGNIYGTTQGGGAADLGTVYELIASNGKYESKLLWSFDWKDGSQPFTRVTLDSSGVFGTTAAGGGDHQCYGGHGCGTAFEIK